MRKELIVLFVFGLLIISGCGTNDPDFFEPNGSQGITIGGLVGNDTNDSINDTGTNLTNVTDNETEVNECLDTDGGKIYDTKGTVIYENGRYRIGTDYCDDTTTLVEYYCDDDDYIRTDIYECSTIGDICIDGSCGEVNDTSSNETNGTNSS